MPVRHLSRDVRYEPEVLRWPHRDDDDAKSDFGLARYRLVMSGFKRTEPTKIIHHHGSAWADLDSDRYTDDYDIQLSMLPSTSEISFVIENSELSDLREYADAVTGIAVNLIRSSGANLATVALLNDWFATLEEIIEMGDELEEIESRRINPPRRTHALA